MRCLTLAAAAALLAAAPAFAQTAAPTTAASAKPKPKPKAEAKPAAAPKKVQPKVSRSAAKAVEEVTPIDPVPTNTLTEAELAIAKKIYVGTIPCELGNSVTVTPAKQEGFFTVATKGARYFMHPVESRTGAIRLEDPKAGALWLQLGNKSMLMNQKAGLRLADECTAPAQITFADEMKKNNTPGLLDMAARP